VPDLNPIAAALAEHFLVARKGGRHGNAFGAGGRVAQATDGTCFAWPEGEGHEVPADDLHDWPRGRHSKKPADFFALAERLSPGPRLELFARQARPGWDGWGDEYPGIAPATAASA
jgi:N6-adenosine-specific RNA methylase IME4